MTVYVYRCTQCGFKAELPRYRGEYFDDNYCPHGCGRSVHGPDHDVRWVYVGTKR
jgi:hypothetical protein